jgi:hypothetical protein
MFLRNVGIFRRVYQNPEEQHHQAFHSLPYLQLTALRMRITVGTCTLSH